MNISFHMNKLYGLELGWMGGVLMEYKCTLLYTILATLKFPLAIRELL